ncbi:MAG TPA: hypothetical protein VHK90_13860 [Thermoanaerobaculia bacterium]|nr:hypothetical protein [Thermoanaerobaculia bacterium]
MSTFAQDRPLTGTVIDVDEGRGRLQIELDDDASTRMTIETDAVSTTYHGFGTVIAGKPEIFTGSSGLSNVRLGDRINVRGPQLREGVYKADRVTLLGRDVPAPPVGVGQTRNPSSVSTQTDDRPVTSAATPTRVEATVRQINEREGRIVVQTTDRRMITVRTARTTPVWYRGQQYTVANLEVGDRIRVDYDPRDAAADEITARRIDVTASVQESGGGTTGNTVTVLDGRVVRVENNLDYVYVDDGRGEVRVDMRNAEDARGEIIRARDLRVGDQVEITGSYNRVGDLFAASTVRFETGADAPRDDRNEPIIRFGLVTLTGTFVETLEDASTLGFRDRETNQIVRIWAAEDFIVRTKGNTYTTVESLRVNDTAVVQAYRDWQGNLIAQTIRLRNR